MMFKLNGLNYNSVYKTRWVLKQSLEDKRDYILAYLACHITSQFLHITNSIEPRAAFTWTFMLRKLNNTKKI